MRRFFFDTLCRLLGMTSFAVLAAPVLGGDLFTRTATVTPGYYVQQGCYSYYVQPATNYSYSAYTAPVEAAYVAPKPPAYSVNWQSETLKYLAKRDDLLSYQQTLAALGIRGQSLNYGLGGFTGFSAAFQTGGDTQYGYSYRTVANQYGQLDLNAINQQVGRNTETALKLGAQANADHAALAAQFGTDAARVAEINARANLIRDAMKLNPSSTTTTYSSGSGTVATPNFNAQAQRPMPPAEADGGSVAAFSAVVSWRCFSCHSNQRQEGKLNMADWFNPDIFTEAKKNLVRQRIELPVGDARHMPKDQAGNGVAISEQEKALFYKN